MADGIVRPLSKSQIKKLRKKNRKKKSGRIR